MINTPLTNNELKVLSAMRFISFKCDKTTVIGVTIPHLMEATSSAADVVEASLQGLIEKGAIERLQASSELTKRLGQSEYKFLF